ncbi:MAG: hypothetical protein H6999_02935 [Hahellaceae bacterium]|nr:hypothetical protein [Hahellaceae bacterium]MCP5168699.1 hypothetical protein [Hahellaceae bacterium]
MGDFEKQHPLMDAIAKTIGELYVHRNEEIIRLKLLKKVRDMQLQPALIEPRR